MSHAKHGGHKKASARERKNKRFAMRTGFESRKEWAQFKKVHPQEAHAKLLRQK
jgi:hypothetical protein